VDAPHIPVLLAESIDALAIDHAGTYVDATFGAGGHARAISERLQTGRLVVFDADPSAAQYVADDPRVTFINANFRELNARLDALEIPTIDGVLFDLGVSSMQLDNSARGFSFRDAGPLDMRFDPTRGTPVSEYLDEVEEADLADALANYGEERAARRIARALMSRRREHRLPQTTAELASFVSGVLHRPGRRERIHPATRTFQALRIAVNDELGALRAGLDAALARVRFGGRVVVITFHSLEDRIVKTAFRDDPRVRALTRKPIVPSDAEAAANPRARSAKLRVAEAIA